MKLTPAQKSLLKKLYHGEGIYISNGGDFYLRDAKTKLNRRLVLSLQNAGLIIPVRWWLSAAADVEVRNLLETKP